MPQPIRKSALGYKVLITRSVGGVQNQNGLKSDRTKAPNGNLMRMNVALRAFTSDVIHTPRVSSFNVNFMYRCHLRSCGAISESYFHQDKKKNSPVLFFLYAQTEPQKDLSNVQYDHQAQVPVEE